MRAPPNGPCEQDWIATGLPSNGCSFMRDTQSIAFFNPPGIDQLYSGVTNRTPSDARIAVANSSAGPGNPEASWMSALYSGNVSTGGAVSNFMSGGARSGKARVNAALYERLRNDPQITSTLNLSLSAIASPSDEISHHSDLMMPLRLFGFEAGRFGDFLKALDVGLDDLAKFGRRRQVRNRTRSLEPLFNRVFGQHLFHRLVKLVDDRLWRAGRKDESVPAKVGNSRNAAFRECGNVVKSRPTVRRGNGDETQVA